MRLSRPVSPYLVQLSGVCVGEVTLPLPRPIGRGAREVKAAPGARLAPLKSPQSRLSEGRGQN